MAAKLRIPFFLGAGRDGTYAKAFRQRLERGAEMVSCGGRAALLIIAIDAADNSITAADSVVPPERSFVHDFVNLGEIPSNVRFLVTARSGRLEALRRSAQWYAPATAGKESLGADKGYAATATCGTAPSNANALEHRPLTFGAAAGFRGSKKTKPRCFSILVSGRNRSAIGTQETSVDLRTVCVRLTDFFAPG
jgi:hypothetical protein